MALTNFDLYKTLEFLFNKEAMGGYLNADKFNLQLKTQPVLLLRDKLNNKGKSTLLDDDTNVFKKKGTLSFTAGSATLPSDYLRYDSIRVEGAYADVEPLFSGEIANRLNNFIEAPTALFPIGEFIGNKFNIYPTTLSSADLVYYRKPVDAVMDFYINNIGELVYLTAGSTHTLTTGQVGSAGQTSGTVTSLTIELEFGDDLKMEIAYLIAKSLGLNLQRGDMFAAADKLQKEGK